MSILIWKRSNQSVSFCKRLDTFRDLFWHGQTAVTAMCSILWYFYSRWSIDKFNGSSPARRTTAVLWDALPDNWYVETGTPLPSGKNPTYTLPTDCLPSSAFCYTPQQPPSTTSASVVFWPKQQGRREQQRASGICPINNHRKGKNKIRSAKKQCAAAPPGAVAVAASTTTTKAPAPWHRIIATSSDHKSQSRCVRELWVPFPLAVREALTGA